jgi:hypothetical protein
MGGNSVDSEKASRWLTLGANVGVLIGLALILIELRQNADLMKAQMIQSRTDNISAKYDAQIHSDYWPQIWAKRYSAESDVEWIDSLDPVEHMRIRTYFFREYDELRNQFFQYQRGYLPDEFWNTAIRVQIRRLVELMAALRTAWDDDMQRDPFRAAVIQIAKEDGLATPNANGVWADQ